ncbi:MAG TPA: ester cyclase [Nocardioides sp.]|jgi:predicted ester cyclase
MVCSIQHRSGRGVRRDPREDCRNHAPAPFDTSQWPIEGRLFGPDEIAVTVTWLRANLPDLHVTIEHLLADGDQAVAWIRSTGTPTGRGPLPPTGRTVDFAQAHRFRLRDGKVVEHWAVRDDLRSMLQAGALTPPGSGEE